MEKTVQTWRKISQVYDEMADEYDTWFEESPLFALELLALKKINSQLESPSLEIGIGTGRFAMSLGTEFGIDPAQSPLNMAQKRGIITCRAIGESLPFIDGVFSTIFALFAEFYFHSPERVFMECRRVIKTEGRLVLGTVPAESSWGQKLRKKSQSGDPYYQDAKFRKVEGLVKILEKSAFRIEKISATLFQHPNETVLLEEVREEIAEDAGFILLVCSPA